MCSHIPVTRCYSDPIAAVCAPLGRGRCSSGCKEKGGKKRSFKSSQQDEEQERNKQSLHACIDTLVFEWCATHSD